MSPPSVAPAAYPAPRLGTLTYYALLMVTFLAASSAPTPLYRPYQLAWGFSTTWLTLVFASYVFALLLTLLVSGSLSDYLGRRPVVALAIIGEIAAMLVFLAADDLAWLLAARMLQGVATGVVTSALAAAMLDSDHQRGPVVASIAPLYGMGFGALIAGALVTYAPAPMHLIYWLLLVILCVQGVWLMRIPETAARRPGALGALRPRIGIPPAARGPLLRVVPAVVSSWALGGFSLSLGPTLIERVSNIHNPMVGCLITFLLPFIGGISVLTLRARPPRSACDDRHGLSDAGHGRSTGGGEQRLGGGAAGGHGRGRHRLRRGLHGRHAHGHAPGAADPALGADGSVLYHLLSLGQPTVTGRRRGDPASRPAADDLRLRHAGRPALAVRADRGSGRASRGRRMLPAPRLKRWHGMCLSSRAPRARAPGASRHPVTAPVPAGRATLSPSDSDRR
ncbi:MFS transporter [Salinicola tamaricis]|uniref:MFS transporter n=1 Tax=Salinicola tamaricis TaxID=1771309 RepID=UPI001F5C49BF|nr:MFS transporter [Salinicola tamaricis]